MAKTEWAAQVMVRLTDEDLLVLQAVQAPGEPRAHTYIRLAKEAALPSEVMLRYRKPPLFPDWMTWGPLSPIAADERGQLLLRRGFEVGVDLAARVSACGTGGTAPVVPAEPSKG